MASLGITAIITTLDNLPNLKEQINILREDSLIDKIVIVNNGSIDGTKAWLDCQDGLIIINRENCGAGPGRNSGIDAAGKSDYLFLDGGIRPLRHGTERMLEYLDKHPEINVLGIEIADFETDYEKAERRWPSPILDSYRNTRLSHTAYCLARYKAFDGLRFSEEGPFGEKAWGADDDQMAYQWNNAGIVIHVITGIHPYRRASGSFRRLFKETGIWPTQYGSGYEKRVVQLQQNWPQYEPGLQWGEPWLTVVVNATDIESTAKIIKKAHNLLRKRKFKPPWNHIPNPYSIIVTGDDPKWLKWAEPRRLRQHHGNTIIVDGEIIRRDQKNEDTWTGDFLINKPVRGFYYGEVSTMAELEELITTYNIIYSPQPVKNPPEGKGKIYG